MRCQAAQPSLASTAQATRAVATPRRSSAYLLHILRRARALTQSLPPLSTHFCGCPGNVHSRSDIKLPSEMQPEPPGATELSTKIKDFLAAEKDFYVIIQIACGKEQIMDTKVMTG